MINALSSTDDNHNYLETQKNEDVRYHIVSYRYLILEL